MAKINLRELKNVGMVRSLKGQKIFLYGSNDCGKSFQSAHFEKPLLLMTEAGGNAVNCPKIPVTKWSAFKDIVTQLTSEKVDKEDKENRLEWETMQDLYQTIIIDTVDNLIELAEKAVCQEFGVRDLSEIEDTRKNGYSIYRKDFKSQIDKLCMYGYTVVFIGHEEYVDKTNVRGEKIRYMQPKGSDNIKASSRFIRDLCDFCVALVSNGVDEDGNTIPSTAYCKETKTIFARSRYNIVSKIEEFSAKNLTEAILQAIDKSAQAEGAETVQWVKEDNEYTAKEWIEMIKPYYKGLAKKFGDKVNEIVEAELGEGVKISEAKEQDCVPLENIYNQLTSLANQQGVEV